MSLVKQWLRLKWLSWLPQNSENCDRICISLWKIQQFPHIQTTEQFKVEHILWRCMATFATANTRQTVTSPSPSLRSGLARRGQTSLSNSANSVSEGRVKIMEMVINHGIRNGKQVKPPSCHEQRKSILPLLTKEERRSSAVWEALIWFLFNFTLYLAFPSWVASG